MNDDLLAEREAAEAAEAAQLAAENADAEEHEPPALPVLLDPWAPLDVDRMRELAPQVRDRILGELRGSATLLRKGRGTVVVPEDTFDLVRRLTAAEEVLRQWSQAFDAACAEARALIEEEALTANGSYPGVEEAPSGSLFVPDGNGQRIAVRPDWHSGESAWDVPSLIGWLIDDEAADDRCSCAPPPITEGPERDCRIHGDPVFVAREFTRNVVDRLLALGRYTPGASKIEALRKRLAGQQRDGDAAVIRQVRSVGPRRYAGVKVTREEA